MSVWADEVSTGAWPRKPWFKSVGALLVPVIIFVTIPITGCARKAPADPRAALADKLAKAPVAKTSPAEKLERALSSIEGRLTKARRSLKAGKPAEAELAELSGLRADLSRIDEEVTAEFAATREVLAKVGSKEKDAIQAEVERDYAAKMAHLTDALDAISSPEPGSLAATPDGRLHAMAELSSWIESMTPEPVHQPLGSELPHRVVDYEAGPPVLGTAIAPAYAPDTPGAIPSTLPVTPTADDLTQTVEVQFTEDISKTANELSRDPVKMYEFVRNTMDFEPYYGSRKGANETLWEKAGNDFDQASLLIALYRYSDIPARYVFGVVEVPIDKAMNWVGVEVPEVAARVFSSAGIPVGVGMAAGRIKSLRIEHCWVEAYVPYESYRGVAAGPKADTKEWVALDPSFKQHRYTEPMDLAGLVPFDAEGLLSTLTAQATIDETLASVTGIDTTLITNSVSDYYDQLKSYLESTNPSATVADLIGSKRIVKRELGLLAPALAARQVEVRSELTSVPRARQSRTRFETDGLFLDVSAAEIASKRITFSYIPATEEDSRTIASYGGIYKSPCYLARMRPVIRIDGEIAAAGYPIGLGQTQTLKQSFFNAGEVDSFENLVTVGEYDALMVLSGHPTHELLSEVESRIDATHDDIVATQGRGIAGDSTTGESLYVAGLAYFVQERFAEAILAAAYRQRTAQPSCLAGRVAMGAALSSLLGVPLSLAAAGPFADIDRVVDVAQPKREVENTGRMYALGTGAVGSSLEGLVLEQVFRIRAVSAVSILRYCASSGVALRLVRGAGESPAVQNLQVGASDKEAILRAAQMGYSVLVPEREVRLDDWQGIAYVIMDPLTGSAGYMVSGTLAGANVRNALGCISEVMGLAGAWFASSFMGQAMGQAANLGPMTDALEAPSEERIAQLTCVIILTIVSAAMAAVFAAAIAAPIYGPAPMLAVAAALVVFFASNAAHLVALNALARDGDLNMCGIASSWSAV